MPSLASVEVERADGVLVIRWRWDPAIESAGAPRAHVTAGAAPDAADELLADVEGACELAVPDAPGTGRRYFRVTGPDGDGLVVAERLVPLEGTMNFRDLGGYLTGGGRRVRWGLLYRSDAFGSTTERDRDYLVALGVQAVHDFRHSSERERNPNLLPDGMAFHSWAIGGDAAEVFDLVEFMRERGAAQFGIDGTVQIYTTMLEEHAPAFGALFTHLADDGALPAVFHCTAGKDRTGLAAALLLSVLGVADDIVLDDYELTTTYRSAHRIAQLAPRLEAAGIDVEEVRPFLSAPREVLVRALAHLRERYGSIEGYLTGPAGVRPSVLDLLRDRLLD